MKINSDIEKDKDYLVNLRRYFHQYPEVSMEEFNTAEKIEDELHKLGINTKRIGETGVFGIIEGNGKSDRIVALRADIDALSIQDVKTESYASKNPGVMHACGHDFHTTSLIGAARYLKSHEDKLDGKVYLFFQQGEEYGKGARLFVKEGLMKNVYRVFGIHGDSSKYTGQVAIQEGPVNAAVDRFIITINGKSAHVSTPQKGVDALYIAAKVVTDLQAIVSRLTNPKDSIVVGIGVLKAGDAYNIVAKEAVIEGTTRCFDENLRTMLRQKIYDIVKNTVASYGATTDITFVNSAATLVNNAQACQEVREVARKIVGEGNIVGREPQLGGDDFADYLNEGIGMYAFIGTANLDKSNTLVPHHADNYDIDEDAILIASNLYADYAISIVGKNI